MIRLTAAAIWAAKLSGLEKLLALAIDSTADSSGRSTASIPLLAELTGMSPRTVARALDDLSTRAMLRRESRPGLPSVIFLVEPTTAKLSAEPITPANVTGVTPANMMQALITTANLTGVPKKPKPKPDPSKVNGIDYDWSTFAFIGIHEQDRLEWQEIYPAISVSDQIDRAAYWLRTNPDRRKRNYRRFLNNWLARQQDRGRPIR